MDERVSTGGKAGHGQVFYSKGGPSSPKAEQTCRFLGYDGLSYD